MAPFLGGKEVEAVLFSPLEGKLTFEGQPVADAEIKLWIRWEDQEGKTYTYTTDNHGWFSIPEHTATYKQSALSRLVVVQKISVNYKGSDHLIWNLSKMNGEKFGELGENPVNLRCELTSELQTFRTDNTLGGIACTWDK